MTQLFEFILATNRQSDWRHIPTGTRIYLRYGDGAPVASICGAGISSELLDRFNAWRMEKHITDIGTMQANAARYGYDDPAQIARDYPAPLPAVARAEEI